MKNQKNQESFAKFPKNTQPLSKEELYKLKGGFLTFRAYDSAEPPVLLRPYLTEQYNLLHVVTVDGTGEGLKVEVEI